MNMDKTVPIDKINNFKEGLKKYVEENIPVQHIIGYQYFMVINLLLMKMC